MRKLYTLIVILAFISNTLSAGTLADNKSLNEQPLLFTQNKGQIADFEGNLRPDVLFTTHSKGVKLFFTKNGISYQFQKTEYPEGYDAKDKQKNLEAELEKQIKTTTYRMDMELVGASSNPVIETENKNEYFENFYLPQCPNGILNVPTFSKVIYKNVYPKIDWVVYSLGQEMKYDFIVHPGGDPAIIKVKYNGAKGIKITEEGNLLITTPLGQVTDQKPRTFQNGNSVVSSFELSGDVVIYHIAAYDKTNGLIIDPGLVWATYYGGSADEIASFDETNSIATDASGNVYLSGSTNSTTAIASGGFQNTFSGSDYSAFLVKFNSSGNRLWATYYGDNYSQGTSVATDVSGNVYLAGSTQSTILASGGFQNTNSGSYDAFLVKFNSNGSRLWATYYGGTGYELGNCVTSDASGNVFLAGWTSSTAGIAFGGHLNAYAGGNSDAYLVKFNSAGNRLWATYYGGSGDDNYFKTGNIIATDANGNIYLAGTTKSATGISASGFQNTLNGTSDAFLVKFNTNGNRLWGTYYGGAGGDASNAIICNSNGEICIVGSASTSSTTGISSTSFQNTIGAGFIAKFDNSCNRIWGRRYALVGIGVAGDGTGNIYLCATINSTTTLNAGGYQVTYGGGTSDAALAKFDNNGNSIGATYFGGTGEDKGNSVAVDASSNIYMAGTTSSAANIANGGFQNVYGGGTKGDAYLAKFNACAVFGPEITPQTITICPGQSTALSISGGISYQWSTGSTATSITVAPNQATTYSVTVNGNGCTATVSRTVNVYSNTNANITADGIIISVDTITSGEAVQLRLNAPLSTTPNIQWTPPTSISSTSIANPIVYPNGTTVYTVSYNDTNGCTQTKSITIYVQPLVNVGNIGITSISSVSLLDTIYLNVQLTNVTGLYSLYAKLRGDSAVNAYLNYAGYTAGTLLGIGGAIISTPPVVAGNVYDFGITKVGAVPGYSGSGIFYTFKFVTKNVTIPNNTNFCFYLDNISAYNTSGTPVGLTNQGPYCFTFTTQINVWPGDLNNSKTVTTADLLPIGYFYNSTGPTRPNATIQWTAQPATLWGYGQTYPNGSAYKVFADSNGDGIISNADQAAIGFNMGKIHALAMYQDHHERAQGDGTVVVTANPSSISTTQLPQSITLQVSLQNSGGLNALYGISVNLLLDNTIFDLTTANVDYTGSIFGTNGTDCLVIHYITDSSISVGLTRYASSAINGQGLLCTITLQTKSSISGSVNQTQIVSYVDAANNQAGDPLTVDGGNTAMNVGNNVGISNVSSDYFSIFPNPANGVIYLKTNLSNEELKNCRLTVFNSVGQKVYETWISKNIETFSTLSWGAAGVYSVTIKNSNGSIISSAKIVLKTENH